MTTSQAHDEAFNAGVEAGAKYHDDGEAFQLKAASDFGLSHSTAAADRCKAWATNHRHDAAAIRALKRPVGVGVKHKDWCNMLSGCGIAECDCGAWKLNAAASSARGDDKIELSEIDAEHILTGFYREPKE